MAVDVKWPNAEPGGKAIYVTVNGAKYAIVRADAWFDPVGSEKPPAPRAKSLPIRPRIVMKGGGKSCGVKAVQLALNPDHPAWHAAVQRATYYPADQVTLTAVSRKKPRVGSRVHKKAGRGKVGVGGMRTKC